MPSLTTQFLLPLVLASAAYCSPLRVAERAVLIDDVSDLKAEYDYVIIGGGTSGLTVADRPTEHPNSRFLSINRGLGRRTDLFSPCEATVLVIEYGYVYGQPSRP